MFSKVKKLAFVAAGSVVAVGSASAAPAAAIDITDFTTTLSNQQAAVISAVGATFVLTGIIVGVKYIKRAAK